MKLKGLFFAAALALTSYAAHAEGFSDTWWGVRDALTASNVGGNPGDEKGSRNVNKVIFNTGHFDIWDYGENFFSIDVLLSNPNEAANNSSGGSTELYGVYRTQLSPDKIFGLNTKFGPFREINLELGGDLETENNAFSPNKKMIIFGPNFHMDVPAGFLNIGVHGYKEWNNNGFCADSCTKPGGPVTFDMAPEFEIVWLFPLTFTHQPIDFRGFFNIVLPKGKTGFGSQTATEYLTRPAIYVDIGDLIMHKPHKLYAYAQLELWLHKFGNQSNVAGSTEVSPVFGVEYHF